MNKLTVIAGIITAVPGGSITVDETWTAADSPYCIEGDLQLEVGATLTMEPGTMVDGLGMPHADTPDPTPWLERRMPPRTSPTRGARRSG
jgi:hypothetical protein